MFSKLVSAAQKASTVVEKAATAVAAVADLKPRDIVLLLEFEKITKIVDNATSLQERLSTFTNTSAKAQAFMDSNKAKADGFLSLNPLMIAMQLLAINSFLSDLRKFSGEIANLVTEIPKIQDECKELLKQLDAIKADLDNPTLVLKAAPEKLAQLVKTVGTEIFSGEGCESKTLNHFKKAKETVDKLDKDIQELNDKTKILQTGYTDIIGLVDGKMKAVSAAKPVPFISTPAPSDLAKIASFMPGFKR